MVLASDINVVGLIALVLAGILGVTSGLVTISDWRGWGTRSYARTIRLPLPGAGFYRNRGYGTYRVLVGGGYVVVGFDAPYRSFVVVFPDGRVIARASKLASCTVGLAASSGS